MWSYHLWDEEREPLFFGGAKQTPGGRQGSAGVTRDRWEGLAVRHDIGQLHKELHDFSTQQRPAEHRQQGDVNVSVLLKKKNLVFKVSSG